MGKRKTGSALLESVEVFCRVKGWLDCVCWLELPSPKASVVGRIFFNFGKDDTEVMYPKVSRES